MEIDLTLIQRDIITITLWRTTKIGHNDLALKLHESQRFVNNCIAKYKTLVKNHIKAQISDGANNKRVVSDSMIDEINNYLSKI